MSCDGSFEQMFPIEHTMSPPQCNAWTLQQHPVVSRDLLVEVGQQGDVDVAQTSSLTEIILLNYCC